MAAQMPPLSLTARLLLSTIAISPKLGLIIPAALRYPLATCASYFISRLEMPYTPACLSRWLLRHYICILILVLASFAIAAEPWSMVCVCATIVAIMPTYSFTMGRYLLGLMKRELQTTMESWALPTFGDFQKLLRDVNATTTSTAIEGERECECMVCWSEETAMTLLPCDHQICYGCLMLLKESTRGYRLCPYCRRPLFTVLPTKRSKLRHAISTFFAPVGELGITCGIIIGSSACRVVVRCLMFGGTRSAPEQWSLPSSSTRVAGVVFARSNQNLFQTLLIFIFLMATSLLIRSLLPGWLLHWFHRHSKILSRFVVPAVTVLMPESSSWYTYCVTTAFMVVGPSF